METLYIAELNGCIEDLIQIIEQNKHSIKLSDYDRNALDKAKELNEDYQSTL